MRAIQDRNPLSAITALLLSAKVLLSIGIYTQNYHRNCFLTLLKASNLTVGLQIHVLASTHTYTYTTLLYCIIHM